MCARTIATILSKDLAHRPLYRQSKTLLKEVQKEAQEIDQLAVELQILHEGTDPI